MYMLVKMTTRWVKIELRECSAVLLNIISMRRFKKVQNGITEYTKSTKKVLKPRKTNEICVGLPQSFVSNIFDRSLVTCCENNNLAIVILGTRN